MSDPFVSVELPPAYGGRVSFVSIEEIEKTLNDEVAAWEFIRELQRHDTPNQQAWKDVYNVMARAWEQIRTAVQAFRDASGETADTARLAVQHALLRFGPSTDPRALHSMSALGRWVRAASQPRKLYALQYLLLGKLSAELTPARFQTGLAIHLIEQGGVEALIPTRAALEETIQRVGEQLEAHRLAASDLLTAIKDVHERSGTELEQSRARVEAFITDQERGVYESLKSLTEDLHKLQAKLGDTEAVYSTKLALSAPVAYWSQERDRNHRQALGWMTLTLVVLVLVAVSLFSAFGFFWDRRAEQISLLGSGVSVAALALALGTVRFLSKLWLSHQNLETAYAEKTAITQAFLAMLNEGKLKDEDRTIALATIFRSAVVDEREGLSATTTAEALVRLAKGG